MNVEKLTQSNILETLHLDQTPQETQQEAIQDAKDFIMEHIADQIRNQLPYQRRDEFERIMSEGTNEEQGDFIKTYVPNFRDLLTIETLRYKCLTELMATSGEGEEETKE